MNAKTRQPRGNEPQGRRVVVGRIVFSFNAQVLKVMEKESWILSRILEKDVPQDKEDANSKISNLIKGRYYDNFKPDKATRP